MNKEVILLGYINDSHTNWFPWNRFNSTFDELGIKHRWLEIQNFQREFGKSYIFICWNSPDVIDLIEMGILTKEDVIIQKVTSMTKREGGVSWGDDPHSFYQDWHWPAYKMCLDVLNQGYNLYAFGCKTDQNLYKIKKDLVSDLGKRFIPIPWSTCMYSLEDLRKQKVILNSFKYDSCFVGSIWGKKGRGNLESVRDYLMPVMKMSEEIFIAGPGTRAGKISNEQHVREIKSSRLCPIINAPSWRVERGVQDRFWTVFASGRFGVADTEGVYDFFNEDEVICETDPEEYVEKSIYFMKNVDKQEKYIYNIQRRIQEEYNWNSNFRKIFGRIK